MKKIFDTYIIPEIRDGVSEQDLETIFAKPDEAFKYLMPPHPLPPCQDPSCQVPAHRDLELPRCLPENLDLSECVVFIGETHASARVFVVNAVDGSLYHAVNYYRPKEQAPSVGRNGYAAIGGKVYFIGGDFNNHDEHISYESAMSEVRLQHGFDECDDICDQNLLEKVQKKTAEIRSRNLEVPVFNLKTSIFERPSKLNGPMPWPKVFVYGGKIYVMATPSCTPRCTPRHPDGLVEFECLDPLSNNGSTWTKLPDPPYGCGPLMLNMDKGTCYVSGYVQEIGREVDAEFDLTSHQWRETIDPSYEYIRPLIVEEMFNYGNFDFKGCIVGFFFFSYEHLRSTNPSICVHDLYGKGAEGAPCSKINLSEALNGYVSADKYVSSGFLNHLGDYRFSLLIVYPLRCFPRYTALCTLSFQLLTNMTAKGEVSNEPKKQKVEKPNFTLGNSHCRTFQLPNLHYRFCKKMV